MGKKIHKVARYQIALNEPQNNMLKEMMQEDAQTEPGAMFAIVLVNEYKQRQLEKNKRPQGRPRGKAIDESNDEANEPEENWDHDVPKDITHYGQKIGKLQMAHIEEMQKMFQAK